VRKMQNTFSEPAVSARNRTTDSTCMIKDLILNIAHWLVSVFIICLYLRPENLSELEHVKIAR